MSTSSAITTPAAFLETWLDQRAHGFGSEPEAVPANNNNDHRGTVTIDMHGVFGIDHVTFSGPADQADAVGRAAAEFMRFERERSERRN